MLRFHLKQSLSIIWCASNLLMCFVGWIFYSSCHSEVSRGRVSQYWIYWIESQNFRQFHADKILVVPLVPKLNSVFETEFSLPFLPIFRNDAMALVGSQGTILSTMASISSENVAARGDGVWDAECGGAVGLEACFLSSSRGFFGPQPQIADFFT